MTKNAIAKEIVDAAFRIQPPRLAPLINFNAALVKDGITRIVNGLEEEPLAKSQGRQENT